MSGNYGYKGAIIHPQPAVAPPGSPPAAQVSTGLPKPTPDQQNLVTMLDTVYRLTIEASKHVQAVVFPALEERAKAVSAAEARIAAIDAREAEIAVWNDELEKGKLRLAEERQKLVADRKKFEKEQADVYQDKQSYAAPTAFYSEAGRKVIERLLATLQLTPDGKMLNVFLGLAAVAEQMNDRELFVTAVNNMYPRLQRAEENVPGITLEMAALLSAKTTENSFNIEIYLPTKGMPYDAQVMNAPFGTRSVSQIESWGVIDRVKGGAVRKAAVK